MEEKPTIQHLDRWLVALTTPTAIGLPTKRTDAGDLYLSPILHLEIRGGIGRDGTVSVNVRCLPYMFLNSLEGLWVPAGVAKFPLDHVQGAERKIIAQAVADCFAAFRSSQAKEPGTIAIAGTGDLRAELERQAALAKASGRP